MSGPGPWEKLIAELKAMGLNDEAMRASIMAPVRARARSQMDLRPGDIGTYRKSADLRPEDMANLGPAALADATRARPQRGSAPDTYPLGFQNTARPLTKGEVAAQKVRDVTQAPAAQGLRSIPALGDLLDMPASLAESVTSLASGHPGRAGFEAAAAFLPFAAGSMLKVGEDGLRLTHNLDERKLQFAAALGNAIPAPSTAVMPAAGSIAPSLEQFGDITLLGKRSLLDPSSPELRLFERDIYSGRNPDVDVLLKPSDRDRILAMAPTDQARRALEQKLTKPMKELRLAEVLRDATGAPDARLRDALEGIDVDLFYRGKPATAEALAQATLPGKNKEGLTIGYDAQNARASVARRLTSERALLDAAGNVDLSTEGDIVRGRTRVNVNDQARRLAGFAVNEDPYESLDDVFKAMAKSGRNPSHADFARAFTPAFWSPDGLGAVAPGLPADVLSPALAAWREHLNAPVEYLEGKFTRPVGLQEFAGAVVPQGSPAAGLLGQLGLPVQEMSAGLGRGAALRQLQQTLGSKGLWGLAGLGLLGGMQTPEHQ